MVFTTRCQASGLHFVSLMAVAGVLMYDLDHKVSGLRLAT